MTKRPLWLAFLGGWLACTESERDEGGDASSTGAAPTATSAGTTGTPTGTSTAGSTTEPPGTTTADPETSDGSGSSSSTTGAAVDCSALLFCDDFEDDPPGADPAAPWVTSENMASITVDETRAFSGTRAVRFTTNDGGGTYRRAYISIEGAPVFPLAGNDLWGRIMLYLVEAPEGSVHWTNIQGEGEVEGMGFRALYRYGGQQQGRLMANYETQGVASDCWQHSQTVIPTGVWTCMEWRFDGNNDAMEFYLDGTALTDIAVVGRGQGCIDQGTGGNWYAPVFDTIRVGWEHYQATGTKDVWIDDVALDDHRIGCPTP